MTGILLGNEVADPILFMKALMVMMLRMTHSVWQNAMGSSESFKWRLKQCGTLTVILSCLMDYEQVLNV